MPKTQVGDLEIAYETHGDPGKTPMLLIMGLGVQLIAWEETFVNLLVEQGYYVIRFDNRDVGESTHLHHLAGAGMAQSAMQAMMGQPVSGPYSLSDMAEDAFGLLTALGIESAHIVGASMGGMIAQIMALSRPERVRSLTSIMSTTNDRDLPPPELRASQALLTLFSGEAGLANMQTAIEMFRTIASPGYPFDETLMARRLRRSVERGYSPAGVARQFQAILGTKGRGEALRSLNVPTLVIHGADDPLVPLAAGKATAEAIPGAKLWVIPGMGHDIPAGLYEPVSSAIVNHASAADQAKKAS